MKKMNSKKRAVDKLLLQIAAELGAHNGQYSFHVLHKCNTEMLLTEIARARGDALIARQIAEVLLHTLLTKSFIEEKFARKWILDFLVRTKQKLPNYLSDEKQALAEAMQWKVTPRSKEKS